MQSIRYLVKTIPVQFVQEIYKIYVQGATPKYHLEYIEYLWCEKETINDNDFEQMDTSRFLCVNGRLPPMVSIDAALVCSHYHSRW